MSETRRQWRRSINFCLNSAATGIEVQTFVYTLPPLAAMCISVRKELEISVLAGLSRILQF
jgi:hypothetical protein